MSLWVVGGRQGRPAGALDRDHGALYERALLVRVDPDTGSAEVLLEWRDPDWPSAGHCFKGIAWDGPLLLLCTERNLVWVEPDTGAVVRTWSHPWLNDVHHAIRWDGALWVASTGLDAVLEVREQDVRFHPLGSVREPTTDVRLADLRPHAVHPNHLFAWEGSLWVTRFHPGDAATLDGRALALGAGRLHDGVVDGGVPWFTAVDGRLVHPDGDVRLEAPDATGEPLGWCRGLCLREQDAWVGFSRIRATRFREHLAWAAGALRGEAIATRRSTRLARYDRRTGALRQTIELDGVEVDAVFGILDGGMLGRRCP